MVEIRAYRRGNLFFNDRYNILFQKKKINKSDMRYWWCLLICVLVYKGYSQSTISTKVWEMQIDTAGYIKQLVFKHKKGNDTIPFFRERSKQGPSFYIKREGKLQNPVWTATGSQSFRTEIGV